MGTPEAGELFLQALTGSGLTDIDLEQAPNFDTVALHSIYDIQAHPNGRLTCKLRVDEHVQNRYRTLHGGCIGESHGGAFCTAGAHMLVVQHSRACA